MRIISGSARGRKLVTPPAKDNSIRPTADRAREALFSILAQRLANSAVLDLFSGTGALGLEAFSRGAKRVVLIDKGRSSLDILRKNVSIFPDRHQLNKDIIVIKDDLQRPGFLQKIPASIIPQFDIIFADPPYGKDFSLPILEYICNKKLLTADGIIVVEERHNIVLPDKLSHLELIDKRTYGETGFSFYQHTDFTEHCEVETKISFKTDITGANQ